VNDREEQSFEAELRRLKPARPPEDFLARLVAAQPAPRPQPATESLPLRRPGTWWSPLRWLAPAAAVAAAVFAVLVWSPTTTEMKPQHKPALAPARPALAADDVEIDRTLVAAYDAVARLPGGEPVRFRLNEWADNVTLRDSARSVVVEQRTPRLEVVPVGFDVY